MTKQPYRTGDTKLSRIEDRYDIVTESGCWIWSGGIKDNGYGMLGYKTKHYHAHRFSYETYKGKIPNGLEVCHHCDVKCCVNPDHLFLGTRKDNMQDMVKKGRGMFGEEHTNAKLNKEKVKRAREMMENDPDLSYRKIAKVFGVSHPTIRLAIRKETWRHVS